MFIAEILAIASRDEILRRMILEFVVKHHKEELKKILEIVPEKVVIKWDNGFKKFLKERKKRRKITTEETLICYRNLFRKILITKSHRGSLQKKWLGIRISDLKTCSGTISSIYSTRGSLSGETYGWITEYVPRVATR